MNSSDIAVELGQPTGMQSLSSAPPPHQQQQQQSSVVVVDRAMPFESPPLVRSFAGHIVLACFTFWCCGAAFGLAAFILAVMAQNRSTSPHVAERVSAGHLGKVSYWMSISGIILGTVLLIVFIIIGVVLAQSQPPSVQCSVKGGHYDHYTKQCRM